MHDSPCISQFLSMKLAAVNPQLGLNIKQLLSKDVSNVLTTCSSSLSSFHSSFAKKHAPKLQNVSVSLIWWRTAFSHPQCSFKFIYSPGILILPRNDAQTTTIVAVGRAPGRCSWPGQFRWVRNCIILVTVAQL